MIGSRVRSSTISAAYAAWASANAAESVNYHQLRRLMLVLRHPRRKSNGIQYIDVAFAADVPHVPDTFRILPLEERAPGRVDLTIAAVDAAVVALGRVRQLLSGDPS